MNFNARLYSKMYDQLAKLTIPRYQAMYDDPTELDKSARSSVAAACRIRQMRTIRSHLSRKRNEQALRCGTRSAANRTPRSNPPMPPRSLTALDGHDFETKPDDQPERVAGRRMTSGPRQECQQGRWKTDCGSPRTAPDIVPIIAVMLLLAGAANHCWHKIRRKHVAVCSRNHRTDSRRV